MEKKLSRNWARAAIILIILGIAIMALLHKYVLGIAVGFVILLLGYGIQFFKLRCPECRKGYAAAQWKRSGTQHCTNCGKAYEYDK